MYPFLEDKIDRLSANYWKLKGFYSFPDNLKGEIEADCWMKILLDENI